LPTVTALYGEGVRRDDAGFHPSTPRRAPRGGPCSLPLEFEFPPDQWCDSLVDALGEVADLADTGWMLDMPRPGPITAFRVTVDVAGGLWHRLHVRPRPSRRDEQPAVSRGSTLSERATADLLAMASARHDYVFGVVRFAHDPVRQTIFVQRVAVAGEASGHGLARGLYAQIRALLPGYRFQPRALTAAGQRFVASLPTGWTDVDPALLDPPLTKRCNGYRVLRDDGTVGTEHWAGRCRVHGLEHPDPQAPVTVGVCTRLQPADVADHHLTAPHEKPR
jgi:hypothetical protein